MEVLRSVGLEQVMRAKSEAQFVQDAGVVGVETLAGGATAHYIANFNDGIRDLSPTVRVFLSQNALEPTLKESAEKFGARSCSRPNVSRSSRTRTASPRRPSPGYG